MKAKALILSLFIASSACEAHAQGTVLFANFASGVNAPVTNTAGERIIGPSPYVADLFWSTDTSSSLDSLTAAGFNQPFSTLTLNGGGYFLAGTRSLQAGAELILGQVRVWDMGYGATYNQARSNGGEFGYSNPFVITLAVPLAPATPMTGLQGFQLSRIPEPSATLLVVAAIALWCWLRKGNRSAVIQQRNY